MRLLPLVVFSLLVAGCSQAPGPTGGEPAATPFDGPSEQNSTAEPLNESQPPSSVTVQNETYVLPSNITSFTWKTQDVGDVVALFQLVVPARTACNYDYELSGMTPDGRPVGSGIFEEVLSGSKNAGSVTIGGDTTAVGQGSTSGEGAASRPSMDGEFWVGLLIHGRDASGPQPHDGTMTVECDAPFTILKASKSRTLELYNLVTMDSTTAAEVAAAGYVAPDSSTTAAVNETITAFLSAGGASTGTWHIQGPGVDETFDLFGTQVHDVSGPAGEWTSQVSAQGAYGSGLWGGFYGQGVAFQPEFA